MTKQTYPPQSFPSLHQSLIGSSLPGRTWTASNVKCLHSFPLSTYGDLVVFSLFPPFSE